MKIGHIATLALVAALLSTAGSSITASADTSFPMTGAKVWGPFEQYWKAHGGLAQFGMPRTSVFPTKGGYDAQWFERAMFTYNPKNPDPYKVELQLLGNMIAPQVRAEAPFKNDAFKTTGGGSGSQPRTYFEQTGHNLVGKFLEYWKAHGGVPIYGYPISEAFTERSKSDGKEYMVQYFERNRLELHHEGAGTPYEVQLGLLGSEMLDAQGGPSAFANLGAPIAYPAQASGVTPPGAYPKSGHAPDYSWVAGQVVFTKIQGGCVFVKSDTEMFAPNGAAWQNAGARNQDYVVIFGHIAGPGDPIEVCPGGKPYIVDKVMLNP